MSQKNYEATNAIEQPKLYTVRELCERFHISRQRVDRWRKMGYIDIVKDGRRTLIPETEIPTFIRRLKGWELLFGGDKK